MIPDEAVEAALKAWGVSGEVPRNIVVCILEAAEPYMLADPHAGFVAWFRSLGDSK